MIAHKIKLRLFKDEKQPEEIDLSFTNRINNWLYSFYMSAPLDKGILYWDLNNLFKQKELFSLKEFILTDPQLISECEVFNLPENYGFWNSKQFFSSLKAIQNTELVYFSFNMDKIYCHFKNEIRPSMNFS